MKRIKWVVLSVVLSSGSVHASAPVAILDDPCGQSPISILDEWE